MPNLRPSHHQPSEITPREVYRGRRDWLKLAAAGSVVGLTGALAACSKEDAPQTTLGLAKLPGASKSTLSSTEPVSAYQHVTTYNNFYELAPTRATRRPMPGS